MSNKKLPIQRRLRLLKLANANWIIFYWLWTGEYNLTKMPLSSLLSPPPKIFGTIDIPPVANIWTPRKTIENIRGGTKMIGGTWTLGGPYALIDTRLDDHWSDIKWPWRKHNYRFEWNDQTKKLRYKQRSPVQPLWAVVRDRWKRWHCFEQEKLSYEGKEDRMLNDKVNQPPKIRQLDNKVVK